MTVLAIIIYVLLNLAPKWMLKEKYIQMENDFNWKIPFIKLTGFDFSFFIAFLLIFGITKSTKDTYIENKNAIYGLEFNNTLEEMGFQDSMKIKSINGEEIEKVSDIVKRIIIENCLFGVDINPKSVMICRLRLWIELLKNAYYTTKSNYSELETLPNIDINIKCGNSLISRFSLDEDLKPILKGLSISIIEYKEIFK